MLSVEQITSRSSPKTQVYTGLLKSVRKNGISTSIVLESLVLGTKVTMRFMIYSPMITRISVLKRADKAVVDAAVEEEEETLEKPLEEQPL